MLPWYRGKIWDICLLNYSLYIKKNNLFKTRIIFQLKFSKERKNIILNEFAGKSCVPEINGKSWSERLHSLFRSGFHSFRGLHSTGIENESDVLRARYVVLWRRTCVHTHRKTSTRLCFVCVYVCVCVCASSRAKIAIAVRRQVTTLRLTFCGPPRHTLPWIALFRAEHVVEPAKILSSQ